MAKNFEKRYIPQQLNLFALRLYFSDQLFVRVNIDIRAITIAPFQRGWLWTVEGPNIDQRVTNFLKPRTFGVIFHDKALKSKSIV
jgi:hypothetical protein